MMEQKNTTREKLREEYSELVSKFAENVQGMGIEGIPAPHLPVVGGNYDKCAYKIAFVGMETKETMKSRNCKTFVEDPETAMSNYEKWLDESGMFKYREKSVYWLFIKHFLKKFYSIKEKELKIAKGKYHAIMSSFVWGNANAIERYEVTAKKKKVNIKVWKAVKEASKPFDCINHLINATHPEVVFITYKAVEKDYISKDKDDLSEKMEYDINGKKIIFRHYILRNQNTHVYVLPHPTWIKAYSGIKENDYITALIKTIKAHRIWSKLPERIEDWEIK